jgi:hypothetical protein
MSRTKSRIKPQLYLGPLQASAQIGRITAGQFEEALKFRSKERHYTYRQIRTRFERLTMSRCTHALMTPLNRSSTGKKVTRLCVHSLRSTNGSGVHAKQGTKYRSVVVVLILCSVIFVSSRSSTET